MSAPTDRAGQRAGSGRSEPAHHGVILAAGALLGMGLGGAADGIVFRQILQWHSMLSSVAPPIDLVAMKVNVVWGGILQGLLWLMTAAGVAVLWWAGRRPEVPWSTSMFVGALSLGWGLFHLVEGVLNHHVLELHHVRPGPQQLGWDLKVLGVGAALALAGGALIWLGQREGRARVGHLGDCGGRGPFDSGYGS